MERSAGQQLVETVCGGNFRTIIEYLRAVVAYDERSTGRLGHTDILHDRD